MRGAKGVVRPVSAIHSYHDVSPVVTSEHVRDATDGRMGATLVQVRSCPCVSILCMLVWVRGLLEQESGLPRGSGHQGAVSI